MKMINGILVVLLFVCAGTFAFDYYAQSESFSFPFMNRASAVEATKSVPVVEPEPIVAEQVVPEPILDTHMQTPESVRGIYVSSYSFMDRNFQKRLDTILDNTTVNAIVVDIKDAPGTIAFDIGLDSPCVLKQMSKENLESRLQYYKDKGIYTIARVAVFRDACFAKLHPELAVQSTDGVPWRDFKGNYWLAPHEQETKEYIRDIARAVYERGFDEIQFDYVRYPSDGNMAKIAYEFVPEEPAATTSVVATTSTSTPAVKLTVSKLAEQGRRRTMKNFFTFMRGELSEMPLSADVFGMVLTNTDDLSIGQQLDDIAPYVDYISGMIYPSHFNKNWNGLKNAHTQPYETIRQSSQMGLNRMAKQFDSLEIAQEKSRPWLQDFSIYGVTYNAPEVKAQIKALEDIGIKSFLLWNASNNYTPHVMDKPAEQEQATSSETETVTL